MPLPFPCPGLVYLKLPDTLQHLLVLLRLHLESLKGGRGVGAGTRRWEGGLSLGV